MGISSSSVTPFCPDPSEEVVDDCDGRINILWIDGLDSVEPLVPLHDHHSSNQLIAYQCIPEEKMRSPLCQESMTSRAKGGILLCHREAALAPILFLWRLLTAPADQSKVYQTLYPCELCTTMGFRKCIAIKGMACMVCCDKKNGCSHAREEDLHHLTASHKWTLHH